ncbi:hypothetical protein EGJ29_09015 [Pseudomonas sp. s199]|nr:hypothetical protein EGJ29_09015 [Pseudomonas sp. s199]HAQ72650.1 hypothetical protein [Pseudomonas sp.]
MWAVQSRIGSAGWLSAFRRPLPGPLVSGSEAIMLRQKRFVNRFVVIFSRHYIFRKLAGNGKFGQSSVSTLIRSDRS